MMLNLFLFIPGIPGSSQLRGHENQIELQTFDWEVTNPTGNGAIWSQLRISKDLDVASAPLAQAVVSGQQFQTMILYVVQATEEIFDVGVYTLSNNRITDFEQSGVAGGSITEFVEIQPENVTFVFREPSPQG